MHRQLLCHILPLVSGFHILSSDNVRQLWLTYTHLPVIPPGQYTVASHHLLEQGEPQHPQLLVCISWCPLCSTYFLSLFVPQTCSGFSWSNHCLQAASRKELWKGQVARKWQTLHFATKHGTPLTVTVKAWFCCYQQRMPTTWELKWWRINELYGWQAIRLDDGNSCSKK